jgi:hypothetical protein
VLDARAGHRGGDRLARPADQLSIYDLVIAMARQRFLDSLHATSLPDVLRNGAPVPAASPRGTAA